MKNIVISLKSASKRRIHIENEFNKQNIPFEFFDAITPEQVPDLAKRFHINIEHHPFLPVEWACNFSHFCLWQKMLDEDIDYLAVFEDDIYLGENAHLFFKNNQWLKDNQINLIKTETFLQKKKVKKVGIQLDDNRQALQMKEWHLGTGGYILSRKTAENLLDFTRRLSVNHQLTMIDNLMFEEYLKENIMSIHQMFPAICIQEFILYPNEIQLPSLLQNARAERKMKRGKRSILEKIKGELSNLWRKTFGKFSRTFISFR